MSKLNNMQRIIGHLDLDAFFASVEERDHEWLRGRPVVVGADPEEGNGRGVVSTANYQARAYGIHSAQPISRAWHASELAKLRGLEPAIFVGVSGARYKDASDRVMSVVRDYVPVTQQTSVDEIYMDMSFAGSFVGARALANIIKSRIVEKEQLSCSVGVGPNKLLAKIASDHEKPNGLTMVESSGVAVFLDPLPIRALPGIGPKTEVLFHQRGIKTIYDLKQFSRDELADRIGKWGIALYEKARGKDTSAVREEYGIKSVGEQCTFPKDTNNPNVLLPELERMADDILRRMVRHDIEGFRTVVVTIRFDNFHTTSRSRTYAHPESSRSTLLFEGMRLLMPFLDGRENPKKQQIRLIGLRVEKLVSNLNA
jgi:DNA polymerase IV (archaeal DinB-like DNA polymerase)